MYKTKLVTLLQTFSSKELRECKQFIFSSYHNKDILVRELFAALEPYFPLFDSGQIKKENVYSHLFPKNKTYNDLKMRHLTNILYNCCLDYLYVAEQKRHEEYKQIHLLKEFRKRGMNKQFMLQHEKTKTIYDEARVKKAGSYYQQYLLNNELHLFLEGQHKREQEPNIQKVSNSLDIHYMVNKLKIYCSSLNYGNMVNVKYDIRLISEIIQHIKQTDYAEIPALIIYHRIVQMLNEPEELRHYYEMKDSLLKYLNGFEKEEQVNMLVLIKNYCIKKLNTGHPTFVRELFEMYKIEFDMNTTVEPGYDVSPLTYKNVVAVGLNLEEFDWVQSFMEKYKEFIPESHKEITYSFNLAKYHFAKKEFLKVIKLLNKVEHADLFLQIDAKILLLKTYYEKEDFTICESQVKALHSFIKRKTLISYHKMSYMNFLSFLDRLLRSDGSGHSKREALKKEIVSTKELVDKEWLVKKLTMVK